MKMKTSVIIGVTQMTFGVCLKGLNAIYFRESLDYLFEFIPMIIFVLSLFGWVFPRGLVVARRRFCVAGTDC